MQVKVIDFNSENASLEFAAGLHEIGFAVVANHPISQVLIDQAYADWYAFFRGDEKMKNEFLFDSKTHDGYVSTELSETAKGNTVKDLKEFYHYYPGKRCPKQCAKVTEALEAQMESLAKTLLSWVEKHSPEAVKANYSMPLSEMIKNSDHTLLRLIHYPPLTGNEPEGAVRAAAHEDINLLTVLPAATAEGLQVQDNEGNWLDVPVNSGWIVVNIGDMLAEASNHYFPSTSHRVINPTGESAKEPRLSMPLFLHPRDEVKLSDRHTAGSYRAERFAELGLD